ncbi:MAG: nucleotidyl transferase AbiEii/AbiGii toxin family protein, partial [Caldisericaceae bacterium]
EIAEGIPAFTRVVSSTKSKYDSLSVLINVEEKREILADKIIAMGNRPLREKTPFKARDVWDIFWLMEMQIPIDTDLVKNKILSYKISYDSFLKVIKFRVENLDSDNSVKYFQEEMSRYIDEDIQMLMDEQATRDMLSRTKELISSFLKVMDSSFSEGTETAR